eukprot:2263596-Rhodomonas_salina.1
MVKVTFAYPYPGSRGYRVPGYRYPGSAFIAEQGPASLSRRCKFCEVKFRFVMEQHVPGPGTGECTRGRGYPGTCT